MKTGISNIAIYIPPLYLPHDELADARSIPRDKFKIGLGNNNMAIVPIWEDTVTMSANAAEMVIKDAEIDKNDIGLIIVSTETGVDHSKPVASFVQGLLELGHETRVYEIKHACYGGIPAIMNAIYWINSGDSKGKKALVITSDIAIYGFNTPGEPTQGAGSIAFLISEQSELFHFSPILNTFYAKDVYDFWRPNDCRVPIVDGKYSIECYLKALEFCTNVLQDNIMTDSGKSLIDFFDYFIYHMPYTKMSYKAHETMLATINSKLSEKKLKKHCEDSYEKKVKPTIMGAKEVGNIYTGSVYMGLISLMEKRGIELENKIIGIFSYGSGCGAEFFPIYVGNDLKKSIEHLNFKKQLERRRRISIEEYTEIYSISKSEKQINAEEILSYRNEFSKYFYIGTNNHKRRYIKG